MGINNYSLEITELLKGVSSVIKRVRIASVEEMPGERTEQVFQVPVDTGFLLFLSSDSVHAFPPNFLEEMITGELEQIASDKPLLLWLKNKAGSTVGAVTSSGYGDGGYKLTYVKKNDVAESAEVLFIPDIEPDKEPISA